MTALVIPVAAGAAATAALLCLAAWAWWHQWIERAVDWLTDLVIFDLRGAWNG